MKRKEIIKLTDEEKKQPTTSKYVCGHNDDSKQTRTIIILNKYEYEYLSGEFSLLCFSIQYVIII